MNFLNGVHSKERDSILRYILFFFLLFAPGCCFKCNSKMSFTPSTTSVSRPYIVDVGIKRGKSPAPLSLENSDSYVFLGDPFSILISVRLPLENTSGKDYFLKIGTGIDGNGALGCPIRLNSTASGDGIVSVECFELYFPGKAQLRVELYEGDTWCARVEKEFLVLPYNKVSAVFFPLFAHPALADGYPRHLNLLASELLYLPTGIYIANGTDHGTTVGPDLSGSIDFGSGNENWTAQLSAPITVAPYSVSEIRSFQLGFDKNSSVDQAMQSDGALMTGTIAGTIPESNYAWIRWQTMYGVPIDVVFIGNYTPDQMEKAFNIIVNNTNGYLQSAGIKLHPELSRRYTAEQIGLSAAQIEQFTTIENRDEAILLASFQPRKSSPRLTMYLVEGSFVTGWVGHYAGGGTSPVDPNTPFRSPIVQLRASDLVDSDDYYGGSQFYASVVAHELGHVFGLTHLETNWLGDDPFNLMYFGEARYSWILTRDQKNKLWNHSEFFRY